MWSWVRFFINESTLVIFRKERNMEWLNYHHLQCFWLVARRGGLVAAGRVLRVTPSTVWAQLRALEARLGVRLLEKRGRKLELTPVGERVALLADELFALGQAVLATARGDEGAARVPLKVGVVASLPRLVARRLLEPALGAGLRLRVHNGSAEELLGDLAAGRVDVVLTDEPPPREPVRAWAHPLGSARLALFAHRALAARLRPGFPKSLDGAPLLVPSPGSGQRRALDVALSALGVRPAVVAEVDDSALLKALGEAGHGVVPAPELVASELKKLYRLELLGRLPMEEAYFAVSLQPPHGHPGVAALLAAPPTRR
jgi:LysR family transcriptional activator of nhaA